MYCVKCGKKVSDNDNYCMKCGTKINNNNNNQNKEKADGAATTSLVLGLISLLLVFSLSILVSPLYITGLIFGLVSKTKSSEKKAGIIINIINIIISIVVLIVYIFLFIIIGLSFVYGNNNKTYNFNPDLGYSYTCKILGENDYSIAISLNGDNTYSWGKYSDFETVIYGTYVISNISDDTYNLELKSEKIYEDGIVKDYVNSLRFQMKIYNEKVNLTNIDNNTIYECDKNKNFIEDIR